MNEDKGHEALVKDISELLHDVVTFQYHDYKNTDHATPKMALVGVLDRLMTNAKKGKYDN